jgi:AraC-like DNA-binding protein
MHVAGRGRILFWEGASLWIMEALPRPGAVSNTTDYHSHHAIQVTLPMGGRFELRTKKSAVQGAAAVAPDESHIFEASGLNALLFIEPESEPGRAICGSLFRKASLVPLPETLIADLTKGLEKAYCTIPIDEKVLEELGRSLVARLAGLSAGKLPEPRVQKMIEFAASHLHDSITLAGAAHSAGLSPSRARHLFVEQTGLPFRTYLLWLKIMRAVAVFSNGESLTAAAHEAGFADSAHFSRTFRRMFGIPAAALQIL